MIVQALLDHGGRQGEGRANTGQLPRHDLQNGQFLFRVFQPGAAAGELGCIRSQAVAVDVVAPG
ncbi:hypothetical protein [Streptomyces sp900116325]|uniref:hypothetical protein n=1 Tax=Streptomyces sp. 900116325 TaxID=3154295 RepID=UPI0033AA7857